MLEVQVVTSANRHLFADRLDEYARARSGLPAETVNRSAHPVGERRAGPLQQSGTVHLLGYRHGRFVSATRLRPCAGFSFQSQGRSRSQDDRMGLDQERWAYWARLFLIPSACEGSHDSVTSAMCCAVMEYCVDEGIRWVGGLQDAYWLTRWADFGWDVEVLGLPERIDGRSKLAAYMRVSERNLTTVRAATGIAASQIVHVGPRKPFLSVPANRAGHYPPLKGAR